MTNHVYILLTPEKLGSASILMKRLGQRVTCSTLTELIDAVEHFGKEDFVPVLLFSSRSVSFHANDILKMNPVRAGMVSTQVNIAGQVARLMGKATIQD